MTESSAARIARSPAAQTARQGLAAWERDKTRPRDERDFDAFYHLGFLADALSALLAEIDRQATP